jgi:GT2 family glycosyltransferase
VIVVDNGSDDGTPERIAGDFPTAAYPNLNIIRNTNNGFSKGNNLGYRHATGETVLILNPDTEVFPDAIQKCMDYLKAYPDIGALGCKLIAADGSLDPVAHRSIPTPANAFYRFVGLQKMFPNNKRFASYNMLYLPEDQIADVEGLSGAFMMLPRQAFAKAGGFDEDYFMYGEDLDLSFLVKQAGFRVVYYPEAVTYHYKGSSTKKSPYRMLYHFHDAMAIFYRKHQANSHSWLMNMLVYGGIWSRFGLKIAQNFFRKNKYVSKN